MNPAEEDAFTLLVSRVPDWNFTGGCSARPSLNTQCDQAATHYLACTRSCARPYGYILCTFHAEHFDRFMGAHDKLCAFCRSTFHIERIPEGSA